jgi:hypothetical protein
MYKCKCVWDVLNVFFEKKKILKISYYIVSFKRNDFNINTITHILYFFLFFFKKICFDNLYVLAIRIGNCDGYIDIYLDIMVYILGYVLDRKLVIVIYYNI